ncbi:dihydrodipicolinate synthase family protein [Ancylobacter amanitiformis]|uniref:4-hydroxy-tetrahydrodipicolinate synthase n=1 Tax=Ancylobacter amanitiformis TaxID=217069 RepID=A0ABU0LSS4_9HYPH|nr:dihydrodipicolinate synthase family protein [Ancylobacter amanitiformis]MDQ0511762.1 4-hydroxy-tetrahydrodipicolinate synthase [Ancylobacter amanitiformis]
MTKTSWQGIHSVLVTPFLPEGAIDFPRFEALADANIASGADGLIVCGSTGEFYAMSVAERVKLFEATVKVAAGRVPVLAGVSDLQTDVVLQLIKAAEATGCDGILALPPVYAKPDLREAEHFYRRLCAATGLPVMLYNSPARIGVNITPDLVARLAEVPNVVAIKDSSADIQQVAELCQKVKGELAVFVGYETMIRSSLPLGVVGVVAMAHQLSGRLVRRYFDACASGDGATADALEPALFAIYRCFKTGSFYAGIKATMNSLGQPVGLPREPLLPFTDAQMASVAKILTEADVAAAIQKVA